MEASLVERAGVPFTAIPAAGVAGVGAGALPGNLWRLARGLAAARQVIKRFRPDVILFTGGYVAAPVALAGRLAGRSLKRPRSLLYVPDLEPGLALKALARYADHIAITAQETSAFLPRKTAATVTGYPVRQDLKPWDPEQARRAMGLRASLPALLVLGGSRGARGLNQALLGALPDLLQDIQVMHVTGQLNWEEMKQAQERLAAGAGLSEECAARYHIYPYLHEEIGAAMSAADLVLSRAGASTLGELPVFGLPAILTPYPYAWRYQKVNAQYLVDRGAAVLVEEGELPARLLPTVRDLIQDRARRNRMSQAMASLSRPQAAEKIVVILKGLASMPG